MHSDAEIYQSILIQFLSFNHEKGTTFFFAMKFRSLMQ